MIFTTMIRISIRINPLSPQTSLSNSGFASFFLFKLTVWDFQFLLCRSHYFPSKPIFPKFWAGTLNEFFLHNNKQASHTVPRLRFNLSLWCKFLCSLLIASACYAKNPYSSLNNSILFKNRVAKLVVLNSISFSQSLGLEFNSVPVAVRPNSTLVCSLKIQDVPRIKLILFVFRHMYMSFCLSSIKCQFWPVFIQNTRRHTLGHRVRKTLTIATGRFSSVA